MSSTENKEIKIKESEKKKKEIDKETFNEIKSMFQQYWKSLLLLIIVYIFSYAVWQVILRNFILRDDLKGVYEHGSQAAWWIIALVAVVRGLLFCLDGWVTAVLKTPFNQMCYAINKAEGFANNKKKEKQIKTEIITKATESNEHCKETLKKFGILNIGVELIAVANFFIFNENVGKGVEGHYFIILYISYFIPLIFTVIAIIIIHRKLKKLEKSLGFQTRNDNKSKK